jgi:asparaginyl-tRNA synthetase
VLRDGTGVMQCVAGVKDITPEEWQACERLTQESAVVVRGTLRADARAPGGVEMGLQSVRVVSVPRATRSRPRSTAPTS